ncbi:unnamed protein product [Trichobilharzia regenti]|nr:unnamed protein product [Trichobilharzia regenti]
MTGSDEQMREAAEMDRQHFIKTLAAFKFFGFLAAFILINKASELNAVGTPVARANGKLDQSACAGNKFGPFAFTNTDMDKVRSALKQFVRDWSAEGKSERDTCYQVVLNDVLELFDPKKV